MNRRHFFSTIVIGTAALTALVLTLGQAFWESPRTLWLKRAGTQEEERLIYWANGQCLGEGYRQAYNLMRDLKANQGVTMDSALPDILSGIRGWFEVAAIYKPIIESSGYRAPKTKCEHRGGSAELHAPVWQSG